MNFSNTEDLDLCIPPQGLEATLVPFVIYQFAAIIPYPSIYSSYLSHWTWTKAIHPASHYAFLPPPAVPSQRKLPTSFPPLPLPPHCPPVPQANMMITFVKKISHRCSSTRLLHRTLPTPHLPPRMPTTPRIRILMRRPTPTPPMEAICMRRHRNPRARSSACSAQTSSRY